MDIDLEHLDYQKFEDLCNDLLRQENGGITSIDGSGGDQGVDGFKGEIDGEVIVYQHKFYTDRLKSSEKRKILGSFETAQENHPDMQKWVLLIALEFTHTEQEWFEDNIAQAEPEVEIECWNKKEIEDKTCRHKHLVQRYFPNSILSQNQRQQELLNYLSASVVEKGSILRERFEEMQEENPHLDIDYEFSSIDDTHRLHLKPESNISINTELNISENKADKIQNREKVRLSEDEIGNIEFEPEILPHDQFEPSKMVVEPWYEDWEKDVQIEIPGSRFKKEFTIAIENITDDMMIIKTHDSVFGLNIKYNLENETTDFNLTPNFENKPIHQISEFLDFIKEFRSNGRIMIRELDNKEPVMSGELTSTQGLDESEWFRDMINRLEIIESHAGVLLSFNGKIDEEQEMDIIIGSDLITEGEANCPFSLSGEIIEGKEQEVLRIQDEDEPTEAKVQLDDFHVDVLGEEILIGDVEFVYPDPELANEDEIRENMGQSGPIEIELQPSEEAAITLTD